MHPLRHFSLCLGHTGLALCNWELSCYLTSLKACLRFSPCFSPTLVAVSLYQAMVTALSRIRSGFICSFIDRWAPAVWPQSCRGAIRYVMHRTRSALPGNTVYWLSADSSSSCLYWLNLLIQSFVLHVMHFKLCLHRTCHNFSSFCWPNSSSMYIICFISHCMHNRSDLAFLVF